MFAIAATSAYWGARQGGYAECDSCRFALGGITEPLAKPAADADEALAKDSLLGRLGRLGEADVPAAARKTLKNCRTGEASGMAYFSGGAWTVASTGALTIAVTGNATVGQGDGDAREGLAWELLDFYAQHATMPYDELVDELADALAEVKGQYSFVLQDRARHRVVAARDSTGNAGDMYWGLGGDGSLMFSSTMDSAIDECASVQAFPSGTVFVSMVSDAYAVFVEQRCPGRLVSFTSPYVWDTKATASDMGVGGMMCRIMSGTDLTLITTSRGYMVRTPSMGDVVNASASMMRGAAH